MSLLTPIHGEPVTAGPDSGVEGSPRKLRVVVVFNSIEGTVAALTAAASYAKTLSAEIVIQVPHVVSFRYPLERPPVSPAYFENLCLALIAEADLDLDEISIDIHPCREPLSCLKERLKPQSLVVIGAVRTWWARREQNLAATLRKLGHDVVLVYATPDSARSHSLSVVRRMLAWSV